MKLSPGDGVVLAVPPKPARFLVPDLAAPDDYRAIITVHFAVDAPIQFLGSQALTCLVNGASNWLFANDGRLSVTISAADRHLATPHEELARTVWQETAKAVQMTQSPLPPWQVVVEPRATFAATPSQEGLRAAAKTRWNNFTLAGDWMATGLPATLEGAIRSGQKAADALMNPSMESR
ncbi:Phytoene desaturase [Candidatus Burkholderia humilis]|nr:Phytoene desaturase [Candidatus Burkholderia humilis]